MQRVPDVDLESHDVDWRAVGVGVLVQGAATLALYTSDVHLASYAAMPFVGGVTTGVVSHNFREEWIDGMVATAFGSLGSLAAIGVGISSIAGLPASYKADLVLLGAAYVLGAAIIAGPFILATGAITAAISANVKRRVEFLS